MDRLDDISLMPKEGNVVLLFQVATRAPCKKFYNEMSAGISELLQDVQATYYTVELTTEIKKQFRVSYLPTVIVYRDGKETKRFNGHYWSKFQIAAWIKEGL